MVIRSNKFLLFFFLDLQNQFEEQSLKNCGLFYLDERKNEFVDRFRGRLIFPIYSLTGKPIAIGGRIIEENKKIAKSDFQNESCKRKFAKPILQSLKKSFEKMNQFEFENLEIFQNV